MRPIDKGIASKTYNNHGDARHDLAEIIGYYCSYCEMSTKNMIEVEHVIPTANGGLETDWNNFLLSCKYCNTVKNNNNLGRNDYLWPDIDNTDIAFKYSKANTITPRTGSINHVVNTLAENTINLMGLNRVPGGAAEPTKADTRWISRHEAWEQAELSLVDWLQIKTLQMAKQIARTAFVNGHYSIWMEVFNSEQTVLDQIDIIYKTKGLYKEFDPHGARVIRPNGNI